MPHPALSQARRPRLPWRAILTVFATAIACAATAAPAKAGDFTYYVCRLPDGTPVPLNSTEWTPGYAGGGAAAAVDCTSDGSGLVLFMGSPSSNPGYGIGTVATWGVATRAPGRLRDSTVFFKDVTARYALKSTWLGGDLSASPVFNVVGDATAVFACAAFQGCNEGDVSRPDRASSAHYHAFPTSTSSVSFNLACGGSDGGYCRNEGSEARMVAAIGRLQFTMTDASKPTVTSTTGTALSPGVLKGQVSLGFAASDTGSGVYDYTASIDGAVVAHDVPNSNGGSCADAVPGNADPYEFTSALPCALDAEVKTSLDTSKVADGVRTLVVDVRDAAGNSRRAVEQKVTIDNVPPPAVTTKPSIAGVQVGGVRPGDALTVEKGVWTGAGIQFSYRWQRSGPAGVWVDIPNATGPKYTVTNDDVDRQLHVIVTATNSDGVASETTEATSIVRSGATVSTSSVAPDGSTASGGNGAGGDTSTGQLVLDREQRTVEVAYGAKIVITGKLVDADSQPIADAQVDVFEQIAKTAAAWNKIGTVKTDSQGGYVYRPKTTASRRLRFAYSDKRDASDYRATREVLISVTAGMTIKARHTVIGRRGLLRLSGQISLEGLPEKGAWVEIQVLDDAVWRAVATRPVSAKGHWTYKHRMTLAARTHFAFRARLRPTGELASAEAKSAPVKVKIR